VEVEFEDIVDAAQQAHTIKVNPWRTMFSRRYLPQLVTIISLQVSLCCTC
jgi:hypothetical protein